MNVELESLIDAKNWHVLMQNFSQKSICDSLSLEKGVLLAHKIFTANAFDSDAQNFATDLVFQLKDSYPEQWNADWKLDVFLGNMCELCWRYNDKYLCYKRAYDKVTNPPDSLLLLLAACNTVPDDYELPSPISDSASELFLQRALEQKMTYEAAVMKFKLVKAIGNRSSIKYWGALCDDLEEQDIHTDEIIPDILQSNEFIDACIASADDE